MAHDVGEVLVERAAAGDIENLDASADGERWQRLSFHGLEYHHLESVPLVAGRPRRPMAAGSVELGSDVGAPGEDDGVEPVEQLLGLFNAQALNRNENGEAAGGLDGRVRSAPAGARHGRRATGSSLPPLRRR